MPLTVGPNLGLLIDGEQGAEHYELLMKQWRGFDALVQASVLSGTTVASPTIPGDGDSYIIPTGATGDWVGHDGKIVRYSTAAGAWEYYVPHDGWWVWVEDEGEFWFHATTWQSFSGAQSKRLSVNAQTGTTYSLTLVDSAGDKLITLNNAASISLEVPTNATVAIPVGSQILIAQIGAGQVTVAPAGGVTVLSPETLKLRKQGAQAALVKIGTDSWLLEGNLELA